MQQYSPRHSEFLSLNIGNLLKLLHLVKLMKIIYLGNLLELLSLRPSLHLAINSPNIANKPLKKGTETRKPTSHERKYLLGGFVTLLDFHREFPTGVEWLGSTPVISITS